MLLPTVLKSNKMLPAVAGLAIGTAAVWFSTTHMQPKLRNDAGALDPNAWTSLPVQSTKYVSHDSKEIILHLPQGQTLGGQTAFAVLFKAPGPDGKPVIRPYTPTSHQDADGYATFVIKAYPKGIVSNYVHNLGVGDSLEVKGPIQKYKWEANKHKEIALLGGGTGITPLYQLLDYIADDSSDKTKVSLYYASQTPDDILLKKEIDKLVAKHPDQFKVVYFVDKADSEWKGETGYISKDFLAKNLFKPTSENVKVFVCGPPPFYNALSGGKKSPTDQGELAGALKELGFDKDQVFKF